MATHANIKSHFVAPYNSTVGIASLPADEAVLIPLYEAYRAISESLTAVMNKPRCGDDAANLLQEEQDRVDAMLCSIASKLTGITSVKWFWREMYAKTLLSHAFFSGGNMNDVLQVAAEANALPVVKDDTKH